MTRTLKEEDEWQEVSPKKHVSLRRRTADEEAEKASKEGTVFNIPAHANTFGTLDDVRESDEELSDSLDESDKTGGPAGTNGSQSMYFPPLCCLCPVLPLY